MEISPTDRSSPQPIPPGNDQASSRQTRNIQQIRDRTLSQGKENKPPPKSLKQLGKLAQKSITPKKTEQAQLSLQNKLSSKAYECIGWMIRQHGEEAGTYFQLIDKILSSEKLTGLAVQFLDLYLERREDVCKAVIDPTHILSPRLEEKSQLIEEIINYCLENPNCLEVKGLIGSLVNLGWLDNTQVFNEYITNALLNPHTREDNECLGKNKVPFKEAREPPDFESWDEQTAHEKLLTISGFGKRDVLFQWCAHRFHVLEETTNHIPRKVDYVIEIAVPGTVAYETHIEADFTPYLGEDATFEQARELFELYQEMTLISVHRENLPGFINELQTKYEKQEILTFLNKEQFYSLMDHFTQLFGTKDTIGEVERRLSACILGVSIDDPAFREFLVESELIVDNTDIFSDPLLSLCVEAVLLRFPVEELDQITFEQLHHQLIEHQNLTGIQIKNPDLIEKMYALLRNEDGKEAWQVFYTALKTAIKEPSEEHKAFFYQASALLLQHTDADEAIQLFSHEVKKYVNTL